MSAEVTLAVDVGGTVVKCALVDDTGAVVLSRRYPTGRADGPDMVVARVLDVVTELAETARGRGMVPRRLGLVAPGVVDEARGVAVYSANIGWRDVPLRRLAEQRLGLPTVLGHDVRAGGVAEARLGAGQDSRHVLFVAIGTGIAAAQVVDGRAYPGAHGAACELGHIVVRPDGPRCGCGARGHLEAVASATAVARDYTAATGVPATASQIAAGAAGGDPAADAVWRAAVDALADGIVTALALFDPEIVVIGGGLAEAGDALLAPLRDAVGARLTFHHKAVLARAALGDEAGCVGAALLALDGAR